MPVLEPSGRHESRLATIVTLSGYRPILTTMSLALFVLPYVAFVA